MIVEANRANFFLKWHKIIRNQGTKGLKRFIRSEYKIQKLFCLYPYPNPYQSKQFLGRTHSDLERCEDGFLILKCSKD